MQQRFLVLAIILAAIMLAGCRTAPLYEVVDAPVVVIGERYGIKDVRNAILKAGIGLGWQMQPVRPGLIVGTLNIRDHMAQVEISYDRRTYSIRYRTSTNLNYDGTKIHSNYNSWVQRLDNAIKTQLSTA